MAEHVVIKKRRAIGSYAVSRLALDAGMPEREYFIQEAEKAPTQRALAERLGVSIKTVHRLFKKFDIEWRVVA